MKLKKKLLSTLVLAFGMILSIPSANVIVSKDQEYNGPTINENRLKNNSSLIDLSNVNIRDFAYLLMDSKEHYHYSDLFINSYQQASGGYIAFAKKTGHLVDKTNSEPNQKWHFFQSWMYQSFQDGSLTWDNDAKSRVYTKLLCPELLLWIYEACGVDSAKVASAYDVAVQGKIDGTTTTTIAKNMRNVVAWEDLTAGLSAKTITSDDSLNSGAVSGITVGDVANFLIDKNEKYTQTSAFIGNHQPSGEYVDFASSTGHSIDKDKGEPDQKWHFFQYWLLGSMKNGRFGWDDDAEVNIYNSIDSLELLLWMFEACGVSSNQITSARTLADNGKNISEDPAVTASKMRECVTWSELAAIIGDQKSAVSVTLAPNPLELTVGANVTLTATVTPSNTIDTPTWSVISGEEFVSIVPNGNSAVVNGLAAGTAQIKISYNESVSDICTVTVSEPVVTINNLPSEINLDIDESMTLNPTLSIGNGTFRFYSSADNIASITSNGVVTGIAYGSAMITVECIENPELVSNIDITVRTLSEGVETLYSTCLFGSEYNSKKINSYTGEFSSTNNGFTWDLKNFNNYNNNWSFVRIGNANAPSIGTITTNAAYTDAISKVVLVIDSIRAQDVNSISLLYGPSLDDLSNSVSIDSLSAGEHTFVIPNPTANQWYSLNFDCNAYTTGSSRIAQVSKIDFYKKEASTTGNLAALIALMNNTNTCEDFLEAANLRELYNGLSLEEQEIFDSTLCAESPECTMAEKLAYMEYLSEIASINNPSSVATSNEQSWPILIIILIGLIAVSSYYYWNKKKYNKE